VSIPGLPPSAPIVVGGALMTTTAVGFVTNDLTDPVKAIGKIVLNVVAVGTLVLLAANSEGGTPRLRNDHRLLLNN
jgi:hypothetical protein